MHQEKIFLMIILVQIQYTKDEYKSGVCDKTLKHFISVYSQLNINKSWNAILFYYSFCEGLVTTRCIILGNKVVAKDCLRVHLLTIHSIQLPFLSTLINRLVLVKRLECQSSIKKCQSGGTSYPTYLPGHLQFQISQHHGWKKNWAWPVYPMKSEPWCTAWKWQKAVLVQPIITLLAGLLHDLGDSLDQSRHCHLTWARSWAQHCGVWGAPWEAPTPGRTMVFQ